MRNVTNCLLSGVLALTFVGATPAGSETKLAQLDWLIGAWKREGRHGAIHESWTRHSDRLFEGKSVRIDAPGAAAVPLEDLLLAVMGGEVFYISKVAENPRPVAFRLVSLDGRSAVFENPEHDFPQRISYTLRDDGTLLAFIEGPGDDEGGKRRIEFPFVRE